MRWMVLLVTAGALFADSGKVVFERKAGAFDITLLSQPSTPSTGKNDFSVMVRKTSDQSNVADANVTIRLSKREAAAIAEVIAPATHQRASNKMLYGAQMDLSTTGKWHIELTVDRAGESAMVATELNVLPPESPMVAHWPYFVALPVLVFLFAFNQRLKRKQRALNRPKQP